ncbi:DUF4352 domain-containing protein [Clostridium sp. E02]|uniref:DUF4352 domain-containing protein n=1 Tax=Clostridium sp. E02 TaxID=2487134 RepID=UPI0013DE3157|nr:DUF4352 domain-containing protein [Clostridium sp. E02]
MKKLLLVSLLCVATITATACGSKATAEKGENTSKAEVTTSEETTEAETEAVSETIPLGESAKIGEWTVTVNNMQILDTVPDTYGQFNPDEGNKYLLITLTASNEGKKADTFLSTFPMEDDISAKVLFGDGYEFSQTNLLGYTKSIVSSSVNPLSSKEGNIAFKIPDSVGSSEDPLTLVFTCGNETLNFSIR